MDFVARPADSRGVKALVKTAAGPGLELTEVPDPRPGDNDVLIRVLRTGICGTDLHIESWDDWAAGAVRAPLVLGHEFVGEVVAVGSGVTRAKPGDLVSGEGHLVCGSCRNCMAGRRHLCVRTVGLGVHTDGAFAELVALPESNVWVHRQPVDLDVAAIFDPFGNAVHTALAFPVLGEDVLITGAGPIGIMAAAVARHAGARHVVITDVSDYRLELARKVGVSLALDVRSTTIEDAQRTLGMKEGFDVGLEMSGRPGPLRDMIANMTHGGRIAVLGLPTEDIPIDMSRVVTHMLTIKGIYGREMYETWYAMSVLLQGGLDISPVITDRFGFEQHAEAFAAARSGRCGKVVIDWTRPVLPASQPTGA
ncbi:L-threonine 3-dehydrogenase [Streptoalloteichus tenebrarius]|uniref:L-threonine 3-dehydrogenase n=1 Tax=Streptoalloteichus tenebrarius (strain ATCC 17920 / DSM 40477 / JCM 4838 / CBS 697.72 / NBRC 16177 / NCIMB 11028 / NRRL B-12390 / A12253. 1 / ISP 5477) TaxID=1933 RepID=A0ABT1HWQ6_STRSD|nr:L-threonine 3-dehydrogenase [Streptoalloteichus tenebrarius]BFF03269.1 L-threonine 3-dehydrogenase [Streptoalloteichus tenebrarius]